MTIPNSHPTPTLPQPSLLDGNGNHQSCRWPGCLDHISLSLRPEYAPSLVIASVILPFLTSLLHRIASLPTGAKFARVLVCWSSGRLGIPGQYVSSDNQHVPPVVSPKPADGQLRPYPTTVQLDTRNIKSSPVKCKILVIDLTVAACATTSFEVLNLNGVPV